MKRFTAILIAQFLVIAIAAFVGSWGYARWHTASSRPVVDEESWFQSQLGVDADQAARLEQIHGQFRADQSKLCEQHCAKRFELGELIKQSDSVTPQIEQLTRELSELEAKSQRLTVAHIFAVSKQLDASQREKFVSKVYDQMCTSCPMGSHKPAPGKQAACGSAGCGCCVASNSETTPQAQPRASVPVPQPRLDAAVFTIPISISTAEHHPRPEQPSAEAVEGDSRLLFLILSVFLI